MIANKLDLKLSRGIAFEMELVAQTKNYIYDPALHDEPADLRRTHAENLEHYGFTYAYIDFASSYAAADLIVLPAWLRDGDDSPTPLLHLQIGSGLTLTSRSVQIGIEPADTEAAIFNSGVYELILTTALGRVDKLVYGKVEVHGHR